MYTVEYYSVIKRVKFCHLQQHRWIQTVMPRERSQREREIPHDFTCVEFKKQMNKHNITKQKQNQRYRQQVIARGEGVEGRRGTDEGNQEVQTSSCKINVMGMKCTVWEHNNYTIPPYRGHLVMGLIVVIILECVEISYHCVVLQELTYCYW